MSDASGETAKSEQVSPEADIARELRLRSDPPRVMRLSRKALTVLAAVGGLGLAAILIVALQGRVPGDRPEELFSTERVQQAEGLSGLPRDYRDVPRLGPPLPAELGRPILSARERGQSVAVPLAVASPDPKDQLRLQEQEAARVSRLFAEASTAPSRPATAPGSAPAPRAGAAFAPVSNDGRPVDATDQRQAFLDQPTDRSVVSDERLRAAPSPFVLQAGSVIPAALVTALRSDLPGQIAAQVTAPVYDSPSGRYLLIPQGSRLIGEYDNRIAFGQRRILLIWTRLILPDGSSILLERQPGADVAGYSGLEDRVDAHWRELFLGAGLATLLNIGAELGSHGDDALAGAIRDGAQDTIGRAGDEIVRRQLSVPPTLTIRPGFPVRVMVTRDLVLEPYRS
jgi:type IV secretion system protein VirB10